MEYHFAQFADEHTQWAPRWGLRIGTAGGPWVTNKSERQQFDSIELAVRWVASKHAELSSRRQQQAAQLEVGQVLSPADYEAMIVFNTGVRI